MDYEWEPRIGSEATTLRARSTRILSGTIAVFLAYVLASMVLGGIFRSNPDVRNIVALSDLVVALPLFGIGFIWYRRVQMRACRAGAYFIGLERHTGEKELPRLALRSSTMFDNLMIRRNVGPGGRYKPHPSASWTANTDGRFGDKRF
ncbi:hypothetical protein HII28_13315 [Planctomonas sp. JC2975]|uniref:hypothetical protein n=1 Tax=Planctomonas sp. JC2975 TaxID=2729626 RepID=UPI001475BF9F|nr:hypothetical protein [Planctomonas sp. JC2975]NNC12854.1 hypothetical protein [Planctomonas sp. JC2975]